MIWFVVVFVIGIALSFLAAFAEEEADADLEVLHDKVRRLECRVSRLTDTPPPGHDLWNYTETRYVKPPRRYSPSPFAGYGGRRKR